MEDQTNTKKLVESGTQTGISLDNYRNSGIIDSDAEKSSITTDEENDEIEVQKTDLELGIEYNWENLFLISNNSEKIEEILPKNYIFVETSSKDGLLQIVFSKRNLKK